MDDIEEIKSVESNDKQEHLKQNNKLPQVDHISSAPVCVMSNFRIFLLNIWV